MKPTILFLLLSTPSFAQIPSSEVLKYGLTAHGIKYLLRDKPGALNAWKSNESLENVKTDGTTVTASRWGNTDCSGLVSASIRYQGHHLTEKSGKPALSTYMIDEHASKQKSNLSIIASGQEMISNVRHGDLLNRTGSPYGHVVMFNGEDERNLFHSVEAKCTKCGVGAFVRSWNDMLATSYKLIRSNKVSDDIKNRKTIIPVSEARALKIQASVPPAPKPEPRRGGILRWLSGNRHIVAPGENLESISTYYEMSEIDLKKINSDINFNRLKVGEEIVLK